MPTLKYNFCIQNPNYNSLSYVIAIANIQDEHDRSAPSDHHWKILKCRMIIFSSTFLASPDKNEVKRVHIIFNKMGNDYDKLNSLFIKFSLTQEGEIHPVNTEIFETCFEYTLSAKVAPVWNKLGYQYMVNNRDFLTEKGYNEGVQYKITADDKETSIELTPIKMLIRNNELYDNSECVRVLPSLNKAIVEKYYENLPEIGAFKSYKDLRRHWKNIHGYRLPEVEQPGYYAVRFWRGEPLTYPAICVGRFPIITPVPKIQGEKIVYNLINFIKMKIQLFGVPLVIHEETIAHNAYQGMVGNIDTINDTQAVSLCTPTQHSTHRFK